MGITKNAESVQKPLNQVPFLIRFAAAHDFVTDSITEKNEYRDELDKATAGGKLWNLSCPPTL